MVVSKGKLKARMLEYFREVERTGTPLIVTDHGREVLEIRPLARAKLSMADALATYRSTGHFVQKCSDEDLMSSGENWDAMAEDDEFESP